MTEHNAELLLREGMDAFRQGRAADARDRLEEAAAAGLDSGVLWTLLAVTRRAGNDFDGEEIALDRLLEVEPQSVRGRIMKADCRAAARDFATAIRFYRSALRLANGKELPAEVMADVRRAEQVLADLELQAHEVREAKLTARGFPPEQWSPRLRQSLEIAAGRKKRYLQQPTRFDLVELPHVQFFDPAAFGWVPAVEAATASIRGELEVLLRQRGTEDFRAYIQANPGRIDANRALADNKDWSALFLCESGQEVPAIIAQCPDTWRTMQQVPLPSIAGWGPTVMFSLLKAGARIKAHTGMYNNRLVCHLPLIVPPGCRFRVGNAVREWEVGKLMIFDDTIEHEAWNDGDEDRVVLIFDVWRPELSQRERDELTALFAS